MSVLDWRELAPPQETHWCDCDRCDEQGGPEPVDWPLLAPIGTEYVTDRYLAIRADLAPIPDDYEGQVLEHGPDSIPDRWRCAVTDQAPTGTHFRWQTIKALEITGWRLRVPAHADADTYPAPFLHAVIDSSGEQIGWAMSVKSVVTNPSVFGHTRPYEEPAPTPVPSQANPTQEEA